MDIGKEINQYKVIEHIGRGGMADVWSARDGRLKRMVAIKTIAHGLSEDVDPVGMFMQEAQTIARMEHPHILPIYDFGDIESQLYIVMRYVSGGSLDEMLRRGPLPLEDALRMGGAIAQALDYAHSNKVVHLDLKPPNVLLDSQQSPYLADFGLATGLNPEGKAQNPGSGTLLYMAPEQMTAEMIDHRADIYSFCIVLFHMLTGQLPFEATSPLALKQLQHHEQLPDVDALNPSLPTYISDVLRKGTAEKPEHRPDTVMEIINEIREVISDSVTVSTGVWENPYGGGYDPLREEGLSHTESIDGALLEAVDIYSRAHYEWANGQGRFLLGVTHFMMMSDYYMQADEHGLELDLAGQQMLLRGAIAYDYELDYWWSQLDDENRRWVCLHAIKSMNAPARIRALYRLETLPDADPPIIPKNVGAALQIEVNKEARLAGLSVLGTRARLMKPDKTYDIKTQYRGRMLTTLTRQGIQVGTPRAWQEAVFKPEIDLLLAEIALDDAMPEVAEFASRIIGRIRSITAVRYIATEQENARKGALKALAIIRDEAPNLPNVVGAGGRGYAWLTNTYIRLTRDPMSAVWRFVFGMMFGWIAMGYRVNRSLEFTGSLLNFRWRNTIAMGLVFSVFTGLIVLFAGEFPKRLDRFWHFWARALVGLAMGLFWGSIAWFAWFWLFLNLTPATNLIVFGGLGLSLGFLITALFRLRSWIAIPLTALLIYIPIFVTFKIVAEYESFGPFTYGDESVFQFQDALMYWFPTRSDGSPLGETPIYSIAIPFALLIAFGGHLQLLLSDLNSVVRVMMKSNTSSEKAKRSTQELSSAMSIVPSSERPTAKQARRRPETDTMPAVKDDLVDLETQMQVDIDPHEHIETEFDVNLGKAKFEDGEEDATPKDDGRIRRVNFSTGIKVTNPTPKSTPPVSPEDMNTVTDVNIGDVLGQTNDEDNKSDDED